MCTNGSFAAKRNRDTRVSPKQCCWYADLLMRHGDLTAPTPNQARSARLDKCSRETRASFPTASALERQSPPSPRALASWQCTSQNSSFLFGARACGIRSANVEGQRHARAHISKQKVVETGPCSGPPPILTGSAETNTCC